MRRIMTIMAAIALLAAACGDDDAGSTTAPPTTGVPVATSEASTTTVAPTSTEPASDMLVANRPAEGKTATYEVETWGGLVMNVPAHVEYDVEWKGGTWTVLVIGTLEEGVDGLAIYLDFSEPGVPRLKGTEGYSSSLPDGQVQREWFEEPMPVDLMGALDGTTRFEEPILLSFTDDEGAAYDMWVETEIVSSSDSIEVPFGVVEDCLHLAVTAGGPYIGGLDASFTLHVWAHPEQFVVMITEMPVFARIELLEGWH